MKALSSRIECILIFCVSMIMFTYGLFNRELIAFETRLGLFAQEMLHNGPSFFPTTYNMPYPDYPSLQTLLIYLFSLPLGKVTILCAILPSALACSITLIFLYLILIRHDRTWAYAAILLSLLTYQFLDAARGVTMDSLVMLATLWAFYCARSSKKNNWGLYCALIFGFAVRGPIGLILPAAVAGVAQWDQHGFKQACKFGIQSFLLLIGLMGLLLFAAQHEGGQLFVIDVLRMQIFGRMNYQSHHHDFFDYFTLSFANYALSFELALLTLFIFGKTIFRTNNSSTLHLLRQCIFWIFIIIIGMSIPSVRKIRYIMPIVPALAILASYWWYQTKLDTRKIRVVTIINYLFLILPFVCLILITTFIIVTHHLSMKVNAHYLSAYCLLSILALSSFYIFFNRPTQFGLMKPLRVMLLGAATLWVTLVFVITPVQASLNRAKPFVTQLFTQLPNDKELVFFRMGLDGVAIPFMLAANLYDAQSSVAVCQEHTSCVRVPYHPWFARPDKLQQVAARHTMNTPQFIQKIDWQHSQNYWFLTSKDIFDQQNSQFKHHIEIIKTGKLGHQPMVIFQVRSESKT